MILIVTYNCYIEVTEVRMSYVFHRATLITSNPTFNKELEEDTRHITSWNNHTTSACVITPPEALDWTTK